MEVHSHSHTARKKWTHYLWEFLMMFLAVFCGFLAENQREHFIEKQRAKQFATALYADLASDTMNASNIIKIREMRARKFDTLMAELEKQPLVQNDSLIFRIASKDLLRRSYFLPITATYQQMKNSGSLRYLKDKLPFGLANYETNLEILDRSLEVEDRYMQEVLVSLKNDLCNPKYVRHLRVQIPFPDSEPLISKKQEIQMELYKSLNYLLERNDLYIRQLKGTKEFALDLRNMLKEIYHLK
jgi:hypothetical protein